MKARITFSALVLVALAAVFAGTSLGVISSSQVVRGSTGPFTLQDKSQKLKIQSKEALDVDIRHVTFGAGDTTGWHGHAGPSLVLVKAGSLTVTETDGKACAVNTYAAGAAFVHPEDAHNFVAGGDGTEIYILYLLPEGGSPAPIAMPAACS